MTVPPRLTSESVLRQRLDVRVRNVDGTVFLSVPDGTFELTDSARFVWRQINGLRSLRDIAVIVATEYQVDEDEALADVLELLDPFLENGMTEIGAL